MTHLTDNPEHAARNADNRPSAGAAVAPRIEATDAPPANGVQPGACSARDRLGLQRLAAGEFGDW